MNERENTIRAYRFQGPERLPTRFYINPSCWNHYDHGDIDELMATHPLLFPGHQRGRVKDRIPDTYPGWARKGHRHVDAWGCAWESSENGITGVITHHPLADWSALPEYRPPDPAGTDGMSPVDWEDYRKWAEDTRAAGEFVEFGLHHGHTFLRLEYLRGYENLMEDMFEDEPRLKTLVGMVESFNAALVERMLKFKPDSFGFPEDLGAQTGPMLTPEHFRRYIKPAYVRLMEPVSRSSALVGMHSDGNIMPLLDDILDCGIDVMNLQDLVNGVDNIAERMRGRKAVLLDIDRQKVTFRGSPADIDGLIREEVSKIATPRGGLGLLFDLYPGIPLANVRAVMDAMEKYSLDFRRHSAESAVPGRAGI